MIDLLFCHLRDDAGIDNLEDVLIMAKRHSLLTRTEELTEKIKLISKELFEINGLSPLIIIIDEKYPYETVYENGYPILQYQVFSPNNEIKLYFDLEFNLSITKEIEIFEKVKNEIQMYLVKHKIS